MHMRGGIVCCHLAGRNHRQPSGAIRDVFQDAVHRGTPSDLDKLPVGNSTEVVR